MNGRLEQDLKTEKRIQTDLEGLPDFVTKWDLNMKASSKAVKTRLTYIERIRMMLIQINSDPKQVKVDDINTTTVQKYFISAQTTIKGGETVETSDSHRCVTWACLNNFCGYLRKMGYIPSNPMDLIDKPKNHDLDRINQNRKLLTAKDFQKILQAVDDDYMCDLSYKSRNKAILWLFMSTGMRKTALLEINVEDVDFDEDIVTIIDKRKKTHVYPLNDETRFVLKEWVQKREYLLRNEEDSTSALFITKYNERMQSYAIDEVVKRYSKRGLGYEISPHKLRAGCASILYNKTHDLEFVRRAIGHADISTTTRYIVTKGKEREEAANIMGNLLG